MGYRLHPQTNQKLLGGQSRGRARELALGAYHSHAEPYRARVQVIKLYYQGWTKRSINHVLHVSRPTVDRWIRRFEAEQFAGLEDKSRAPKAPARKVWLPLMIDVYHLQKRHPRCGRVSPVESVGENGYFGAHGGTHHGPQ